MLLRFADRVQKTQVSLRLAEAFFDANDRDQVRQMLEVAKEQVDALMLLIAEGGVDSVGPQQLPQLVGLRATVGRLHHSLRSPLNSETDESFASGRPKARQVEGPEL